MSNSSNRLELRLKEREDEYTRYEQFYVLVGTFNVNNKSTPPNILLEQWFSQATENRESEKNKIPDIIAVGFQEIDTSGGAYIYDDKKKEDDWERIVRKTIAACYEENNTENIQFTLLNRIKLVGILLFVYVRSTHLARCTLVSNSTVPTGFMGIAGNKGGVGVRFRFYETDICFVNSHFASGDGQKERRNEDYLTIEARMAFTDGPIYSLKDYIWYTPAIVGGSAPANPQDSSNSSQWWKISDHDIIFWLGDMNYRISQPNDQVRKAINEVSIATLQKKDQLRCEMELDRVFSGYFEPSIDFLPTYKFDINTDNYDTSEKSRTPSWTDRILYRSKRPTVFINNQIELDTIQTIKYSSINNIKFSDHRPVSGLYLVAIKYQCDEKRSNRIREELIREFDRAENESIPTIEVHPRPPQIIFNNVRYLDKPTYPLTIKNIGECSCTCTIVPSSISSSFHCLTFTPNTPYAINVKQQQHVNIGFNAKTNLRQISDIIILHVEKGADTFITLDVTLDKGPFCLSLDDHPITLYNNETKKYIYSNDRKPDSEHIVEMINDPPIVYISLIDCLRERNDVDLLNIFNSDTQDSLDLIPIRDKLYENNYDFTNNSTGEILMIFLYLLQSLPQPLISYEIQDKIFLNAKETLSRPEDMAKAVSIIIERLKAKERNLFFRFLLLVQKSWPTKDQIEKANQESGDTFNICIDILALSILHEHLDRNQRHAFILACLNEEKKN
ncbi:unnamed protein product [Rotaria magnacalcarata]